MWAERLMCAFDKHSLYVEFTCAGSRCQRDWALVSTIVSLLCVDHRTEYLRSGLACNGLEGSGDVVGDYSEGHFACFGVRPKPTALSRSR